MLVRMSKKIKYPDDTVIELLQQASLIEALGKTAIQTTKFEGEFTSDNVLQNVLDLKSSMNNVLEDLQILKDTYAQIDKNKSEMEKKIKNSERAFLAFQKEQISNLDSIKKEYEKKLNITKNETRKKEERAKNEAQQEVARKEREHNKQIKDTEREVSKNINDADRLKNNQIKQITNNFEKFQKDSLKEKQKKLSELHASVDQIMIDINNLKEQISKKEEDAIKLNEKIDNGRTDLKENLTQLKSEITKLKESLKLKENTIDINKQDLEDKIQQTESHYSALIADQNKFKSIEISKAEGEFENLKESELERLENVKLTEVVRFEKLRESRTTSVAELRAQQKAIMKAFEEHQEDTITVAEREAKKAIEDKRIQIDKEIETFKNEFESYRHKRLFSVNKNLTTSVTSLSQKITVIK